MSLLRNALYAWRWLLWNISISKYLRNRITSSQMFRRKRLTVQCRDQESRISQPRALVENRCPRSFPTLACSSLNLWTFASSTFRRRRSNQQLHLVWDQNSPEIRSWCHLKVLWTSLHDKAGTHGHSARELPIIGQLVDLTQNTVAADTMPSLRSTPTDQFHSEKEPPRKKQEAASSSRSSEHPRKQSPR